MDKIILSVFAALTFPCFAQAMPAYPLSSDTANLDKIDYIYLDASKSHHTLKHAPDWLHVEGLDTTEVLTVNGGAHTAVKNYMIVCQNANCGVKVSTYAISHAATAMPALFITDAIALLDDKPIIFANYSYGLRRFKSLPASDSYFDNLPATVHRLTVDGDTIYASTQNGLSVSYDQGHHWHTFSATNGLGTNQINATYLKNGRLYVATYGGGLVYSDDLTHWHRTAKQVGNTFDINGFPGTRTLFLATAQGLLTSFDDGATWRKQALCASNPRVTAVTPGSDNKSVVAVSACGLYVSLDGGHTFKTVEGLTDTGGGNTVEQAYITEFNGKPLLFYTVFNGGLFNGSLTANAQGAFDFNLISSQRYSDISDFVVVRRSILFAPSGNPTWSGIKVGKITDGGTMSLCADSALDNINNVPSLAHAGTDGVVATANGTLYRINLKDRQPCSFDVQTVSQNFKVAAPTDIQHIAANASTLYVNSNGTLYASSNGGNAWQIVHTPFPITAVAAYDKRIFIGGDTQGLYESDDGGQTWQATGLTGSIYTILPVQRQGQLLLYVGKSSDQGLAKGVYDAGQWHWQSLMATGWVVDIIPGTQNNLYALLVNTGVAVIKPTDRWHLVGQRLPNKAGLMAIAAVGNDIYVGIDGTVKGVYRLRLSADERYADIREIKAMHDIGVLSLTVDHGVLYAGSDGQGLWVARIQDRPDQMQWRQYTTANGLGADTIYSLLPASNALYVGTTINGLSFFGIAR